MALFKLDKFKIRYIDEVGDAINIDNDRELKEATDLALNPGRNNDEVVIMLSLEKMDTQFSNYQENELPNIPNIPSGNSNENNNGKCQLIIIDNKSSSTEFGI